MIFAGHLHENWKEDRLLDKVSVRKENYETTASMAEKYARIDLNGLPIVLLEENYEKTTEHFFI